MNTQPIFGLGRGYPGNWVVWIVSTIQKCQKWSRYSQPAGYYPIHGYSKYYSIIILNINININIYTKYCLNTTLLLY